MKTRIRPSITTDALDFDRIKNALPLNHTEGEQTQGGFLLGTDIATYQFYIENGLCFTAEYNNDVVGFGVILPDAMVKQSELWEKREAVNWAIDIEQIEQRNIGYIEQLAVLKGYRKTALSLAYHLVKTAFDSGIDYMLTTTVRKPVLNLAAVPYIRAVGGRIVGQIDEQYPDIGSIKSHIHLIESQSFYNHIDQLKLLDKIKEEVCV